MFEENNSSNYSFKTRLGGRPGPRFGFRVLTGSAKSIFFKKNSKRRRLSKKIKVNGFANGFFWVNPRGHPGHTGFFLPLFFLQPDLVPAPGRPGGPDRVSKL